MRMNRRGYLKATGALAGGLALAGCSEETEEPAEEQDTGVSGGPKAAYEESINRVDGQTIVDLSLRAWFDCTYASPQEATFIVEVIAAGEVVGSETWTVAFEDCMVEHSRFMSFTLDGEWDSLLIRVSQQEE